MVLVAWHPALSRPTWNLQLLMALLPMRFGNPAHLEAYVPQEVEVLSIHPEVFQDKAVGQVTGKILWVGEVAEAGHLLRGVGDD